MKRKYIYIILFIVLIGGSIILFLNKDNFVDIKFSKFSNLLTSDSSVIYIKNSDYKNKKAKSILNDYSIKNNIDIYSIKLNKKEKLKLNKKYKTIPLIIFVKNGKVIYLYKNQDVNKIKDVLKEIYKDVCSNKKEC